MTKQPYCYDDALDYFEQTKELLTKSLEIEPNQVKYNLLRRSDY